MATRRAIANGNWSATGTWNGGVVPTDGDTVFSNGFNVTLDVDVNIGGANNPTVNTGSLVSGQWYEIVNVGGQTWTTIGAASNTVGTVFQSTGTGTAGNLGTAKALATLTTATNTAAGATTGGGGFTMSTIRAMTCDLRPGATICLDVTATTGTLALNGLKIVGGTAIALRNNNAASITATNCVFNGLAASAFQNASTGIVSIDNSTLTAGGSGQAGHGAVNSGAGSITVSLSTLNGGASSSNTSAVQNASTGTVTINSSTLTGGSGGTSYAFQNATTGSTIINSSAITAGTASFALHNSSTGSSICTGCTFTASAFTNAVSIVNNSADVRLSGDFLDHWSGWKAVSGNKWRLGTTPTAARTRYALAGTTDSYVEMFTADNTGFGLPAATDVRSGVSYGGGAVTGLCAVPAAGSTALGVPVDAGYGTAVLTPEAVWGHTSRTLTAGAGISASDVWAYNSRTLTTSSGPTAVEIRQEIDANSTKLDATVSSRLASSAYSAAPTTAQIATAVEGSLLNEADGQAVLNALVSAIGNQNVDEIALVAAIRSDLERSGGKLDSIPTDAAPSAASVATAVWSAATKEITGGTVTTLTNSPDVPTEAEIAAQVRTELSVELGRIDQSISTRLAGSAYTAPANSDVAAIKVKTDAINVDRINNTATTAIVGNLLAQANS